MPEQIRRLILKPASLHPNEEWVVAQADLFARQSLDNESLRQRLGGLLKIYGRKAA